MREIKFRAWCKPEKKFHEIDLEVILYETLSKYAIEDWDLHQFTGLIDKNGKEIYEGDVVRDKHGIAYEVIREDYKWNLKNFYAPCFDTPGDGFSEELDTIEVIGNIHDNPKLLEDK